MNKSSDPMNVYLHDLLRVNSSKSLELVSDNARSVSPVPTSSISSSRRNSKSDDELSCIFGDGELSSQTMKPTTSSSHHSEPNLCYIHDRIEPSQHSSFEFSDSTRIRRRNSDPTLTGTPNLTKKTPIRSSPIKSKGLFCPGIESLSTDRIRPLLSSSPTELPH